MPEREKPKICAIVPNYNYSPYIFQALDGLVYQTLQPDLIIISDDGSTDNSVNYILDELDNKEQQPSFDDNDIHLGYYGSIKTIVISSKKNRGPSAARNRAIKYAGTNKWDIFAFCDSDDYYYSRKIEESVNAISKFPHCALVYTDYDTYNTQSGNIQREYKEPFNADTLLHRNIVSTNSIVSSNIFDQVGLFDENLRVGEDYDMWIRISEVGVVHHIAESLFMYKVTGEGTTFSVDQETWQKCHQIIAQKTMQRRDNAA